MPWGEDERPFFGGLYPYEATVSLHLPKGAELPVSAMEALEGEGRFLLGQVEMARRAAKLPSLATHARDPYGNYFEFGAIMGQPFIRIWPAVEDPAESEALWQFYCIGKVGGVDHCAVSNTALGEFPDLGAVAFDNLAYAGGGFGACIDAGRVYATRSMLAFQDMGVPGGHDVTVSDAPAVMPGNVDEPVWGVAAFSSGDYPVYVRRSDGSWMSATIAPAYLDMAGAAMVHRLSPAVLVAGAPFYAESSYAHEGTDWWGVGVGVGLRISRDNGASWSRFDGAPEDPPGSALLDTTTYQFTIDDHPQVSRHMSAVQFASDDVALVVVAFSTWAVATGHVYGYMLFRLEDWQDAPSTLYQHGLLPGPYVESSISSPLFDPRFGSFGSTWTLAGASQALLQSALPHFVHYSPSGSTYEPGDPAAMFQWFRHTWEEDVGRPYVVVVVSHGTGGTDFSVYNIELPWESRHTGLMQWLDDETLVIPAWDDGYFLYQSTDMGVTWTVRATISADGDPPDENALRLNSFHNLVRIRRDGGRPAYVTPAARWVSEEPEE